MQIDRLIQIIFLLLSHQSMTAKQLEEEFGVSTRTIYQDINILSIAGIPITSQKGYGGGLSLLKGFSLDKSYFTKAEQGNIIRALQILKSHAWYLIGYSRYKQDIRTYKMSRIRNLQITNELFDRELPKDFSLTLKEKARKILSRYE